MSPWYLKLLLISAIMAGVIMVGVVYFAKTGRYVWHRRLIWLLSLPMAVVLGIAEWGVRYKGWRDEASFSPFYDSWLFPVLVVHIVVAASSLLLWVVILSQAEQAFGKNPRPGPHSSSHKKSVKLFLIGFYVTIATGCLFYFLAFEAA